MDLFPLRDVIRPLYWARQQFRFSGQCPTSVLQAKSHTCDLINLSHSNFGVSRAIAGREIRGNRVTVDGEIVRNAAFKLLPEHDVAYDGNPLAQQHGPRYFMLNKPQGYVCSTDDPDHPNGALFS
ncbi:16S rRNA pseudouridylate synthase A [Escherichia coli]|uniref:Dual-specificity RNA pseudouridine synthase RluF n=1 Tax=Escherichia coli TaxID=562 RepID=A0A376Y8A6_ECOLX|nr:16S rRNA pseudouridylate synthase A [Escherichia coli]